MHASKCCTCKNLNNDILWGIPELYGDMPQVIWNTTIRFR